MHCVYIVCVYCGCVYIIIYPEETAFGFFCSRIKKSCHELYVCLSLGLRLHRYPEIMCKIVYVFACVYFSGEGSKVFIRFSGVLTFQNVKNHRLGKH